MSNACDDHAAAPGALGFVFNHNVNSQWPPPRFDTSNFVVTCEDLTDIEQRLRDARSEGHTTPAGSVFAVALWSTHNVSLWSLHGRSLVSSDVFRVRACIWSLKLFLQRARTDCAELFFFFPGRTCLMFVTRVV